MTDIAIGIRPRPLPSSFKFVHIRFPLRVRGRQAILERLPVYNVSMAAMYFLCRRK